MQIAQDYQTKNGKEVWSIVTKYVTNNNSFFSVTGIKYIAETKGDFISYKGGKGDRANSGETIDKDDFIDAFDNIKTKEVINTNSIKTVIPNSLYRKRTPFIGLLYSAGILNK